MIFDLKDLDIEILKKFDREYNYFNPSHFNGRTIFRRESKFEDKLLVSDIVDDQDVVLLQHHTDDTYMWSYEDARFINDIFITIYNCIWIYMIDYFVIVELPVFFKMSILCFEMRKLFCS